jgi:hypothetical protein
MSFELSEQKRRVAATYNMLQSHLAPREEQATRSFFLFSMLYCSSDQHENACPMGGFTWVLAGLKAYLEHNIMLNLIADRFPKGLREHKFGTSHQSA